MVVDEVVLADVLDVHQTVPLGADIDEHAESE